MILSLILLALAGAIAFFHYTQGFFSAAISAILVLVAAAIAVGYHESVASFLLNTRFAEEADAIALAILFGGVYFILRLIFDLLVPGNVRFPVLVDKIGAGAMGVVAGLFSTGVVAVAAQTLPFGPDVGYYSRFAVSDKTGQYMGQGSQQDVPLYDVTQSPTLNPDDEEHLWLHQDDLVLALAYKLSDGGSLAADQSFASIHPDYLAELFGQRLGIQVGARRTMPGESSGALNVSGVYTQPELTLMDGEPPLMRPQDEPLQPSLKPTDPSTQTLLIVRATINGAKGVADTDNLFRFSPGSVRLTMGHSDTGYADYHPVATLDRRGVAVASRVDDFLLADLSGSRTIDLIFLVDNDRAFGVGAKGPPFHLSDGTFLEIKRYGQVDISGKKVDYGPPTNKDKLGIERKPEIKIALAAKEALPLTGVPPPAKPLPGAVMGDTGLIFQEILNTSQLYAPIDVHVPDANGSVQFPTGVNGNWEARRWVRLTVSADRPLSQLQLPGTNLIDDLQLGDQSALVVIHCTLSPAMTSKRPWDWCKSLTNFAMADAGVLEQQEYKLTAVWAHFTQPAQNKKSKDIALSQPQDYMIVSYRGFDSRGLLQLLPPQVPKPLGVEVWLAVEVPKGATMQELRFNGNAVLENLGFKAQVVPTTTSTRKMPTQLPGSE